MSGETSGLTSGLFDRRQLFWLLQTAGWLGFGAVMFAWGLAYWPPLDALMNKGILIGLGFALTLGFQRIYKNIATRGVPNMLTGVAIVACSFIGAGIWIEVQSTLFQAYFSARHEHHLVIALTDVRFGTLLFYGFVLLTWSLLYHGIDAWESAQYERRRAERAEVLAREARLRALQAQLNPHFIFNALNIASTLINEDQPAEANQMIARLSEFLRLALDTLDTPEIAVAQEIQFVRSYLDIEHTRFGARLQTTIDATPEAMSALIPTLILQPLVENSIKHGILSQEQGGSVNISITTDGNVLRIAVADSGRGTVSGIPPRRGIGLSNTAARLSELYGDRASLTFATTAQGGMTEVAIPLRTHPIATPATTGREAR